MTEQEIRILFGQNVKRFRKEKNISQMQLAEKSDLTFNFINDIENGKKWVSPNTLSKLSAALDVQPYHFFLPVQNMRIPHESKLLSTFSDDLLNQISKIFRETTERYK
ncbi:MAG: helix-turn-helix domain-containing protein [Treponemataceae bacterium]|nr:helix-turn-helix domain-containing protein [Treponemataceae bacterium]